MTLHTLAIALLIVLIVFAVFGYTPNGRTTLPVVTSHSLSVLGLVIVVLLLLRVI